MTGYLETIDTPTLSNAIELLNVRKRNEGFTPLQIRCLFPEFGRMCGYAVTAQVETVTTAGPMGREGFPLLFEALAAAPKPAVVVLQEVGGFPDYAAHCGEVMATIFTRLGAVGLVSDCGVRDIPEVRSLGMHYFARGCVASHAYYRVVRANVPVQILGMAVQPGDILHGDENGLIAVPAVPQDELRAAVEQVRTVERKLMDYVRGPEFALAELAKRFFE